MAEDTKTLTGRCYCKAVHIAIDVPAAKLPLGTHLCHCSICRYTHGTFNVFHANIPADAAVRFVAPSSLDCCTGYQHATAKAVRYFCSTCGCAVGDIGLEDGGWVVSTALFDADRAEKPFAIRTHCLTAGLHGDGQGLHSMMPDLGGRPLRRWEPDPATTPWMFTTQGVPAPQPEAGADGQPRLRAECHCGGVSFTVPRPPAALAADPDLARFLSPAEPTKWPALLDVCDDCRLVTGAHVVGWTFVPRALIEPPLGEDLRLGTLTAFRSSPGVLRAFCGTCGATALYTNEERRFPGGEVVDVAVGLLRAPDGVLATDWLHWRVGRTAGLESGKRYDEAFATALAEGARRWGDEKYGEAPTYKIG